jgi:hypothetical protein
VTNSSVTSRVQAPADTVVTDAMLAKQAANSPQRAFLEMWSSAQWQSWVEASGYFAPGLRHVIGGQPLIEVLKSEATVFRAARPAIAKTRRAGRQTILRYSFKDAQGDAQLHTVILRQRGNRWQIYYDSLLDQAVRSWAQSRAQGRIAPSAAKADPRAVTAGLDASAALTRFLERTTTLRAP